MMGVRLKRQVSMLLSTVAWKLSKPRFLRKKIGREPVSVEDARHRQN